MKNAAAITNTVTLDSILCRSGEVLFAPVNDEQAVMMSVESQRYYGLDSVGKRIWELLEEPTTVAAVAERLLQEFEVDRQTCQAATLQFAQELIDHGVARVAAA